MQVEFVPLARVIPYARNPRKNQASVAKVAGSLREFGWQQPIVVDSDMVVVAGHTRLEAARLLGFTEVPVHIARDLTPAQVKAYRIADNRLHEDAEWDEALLKLELGDLRDSGTDLALTGFEADELAGLLLDASDGDAADADEIPAARPDPITRPGNLWRLGGHRLLCADSTDPDVVARVMDGERAALLFTSPPYGSQRDYTTGGVGDWDALMQGVFRHAQAALHDDGQLLVNLGLIHRDNEWVPYWQGWLDWMRTQGWRRFGLYTWDQGPGLPGDWNGRLSPAFELLFHFNRTARQPNKIIPCRWAGHVNSEKGGLRSKDGTVGEWQHAGQGVQDFRIPDSVLRITRHKGRGIETEHPAVFPVLLPEFLMQAYSDAGEVVFEPFAGSGTTILAGQRTGRRVRAIEMAPGYVDLAIARWQLLHPELPATLDGDGRSFEAIAADRIAEAA